jgi:Na+-translocating ferredoxin:NAD+ oxidoreductase RNF subunit RnfB
MIITAIVVLGVLGFIFAALLALAADYFKVDEDRRIVEIVAVLPGINCGACGAGGCHDFAAQVAKGEMSASGCVVGGESVAKKVAAIMGTISQTIKRNVAVVHCGADKTKRQLKANYHGVQTCLAADLVDNGGLKCAYGCLGFGDCMKICSYDAIVVENGLAKIDSAKCTACNKCIIICPRKIISLRPAEFAVMIACSSRDNGAETRQNCPVGCLACKICEKEVPTVFKVVNNLAEIEYSKTGVDCKKAVEKCPTRCIWQS